MLQSMVSWWGSRPLTMVSRVSSDGAPAPWVGRKRVCVVGCVLVWHGVDGAQQHALSPLATSVYAGIQLRYPLEVPRIQGQLTIFTAASLTEAFKEMGANIEQGQPRHQGYLQLAGLADAPHHLAQGARADVLCVSGRAQHAGGTERGHHRQRAPSLRAQSARYDCPCRQSSLSDAAARSGEARRQAGSHQ